MSFLPQIPSDGPPWLPRFASSIADLFRRVLPAPLKLFSIATADLPPAADYQGGIIHDSTADTLKIALGAGWSAFSLSTHVHAAADVTFAPAGGIAATDVQAAIVELDTEKLAASSYTAADVLAKLLTVDGAGSGLDADLLDGQQGAHYLDRANHTGTATDLTVSGLFRLSGAGDVTLASVDHPFQIGADASFNLAVDRNEMQARNNGGASEMHLNQSGGTVYVGHDHSSDASISSTAHHLQVGPTTGLNLRFDGNEILAVNNGATSTLFLNNDGGSPVSIGGGGLTLAGALTYGGVTLANSVTGTGSMALSANPTFTGTVTAAAATFSGSLTANGGVVTGSIFVQGSSPEATLKDTDTAGNAATMVFAGRDSANAVQWRVGRPFTTVLRFENLGGSFGWYNALGAGQMMLLDATGLDVVGLVRCDSFRIDVAPTAAAVAQTHHVPISINGVTYKLLLAS